MGTSRRLGTGADTGAYSTPTGRGVDRVQTSLFFRGRASATLGRMLNQMRRWVGVVALVSLAGACGGSASSSVKREEWRAKLRTAMQEDVPTRDKRDELSRLMVEAVENGALDRLNQLDVQNAFGKGLSCDGNELCEKQGFESTDWYYPIGNATDDKIKQLPILIVGFDGHGRVSRVYTLKTH
jgi:hypothetical protein